MRGEDYAQMIGGIISGILGFIIGYVAYRLRIWLKAQDLIQELETTLRKEAEK